MLFQSIFTTAVFFAASALALPTDIDKRQSATSCGGVSYTAGQVSSAVSAGYKDYQNGVTYGSNDYPHTLVLVNHQATVALNSTQPSTNHSADTTTTKASISPYLARTRNFPCCKACPLVWK